MMHRWPAIRAHMGPQFIMLLDWYTSQRDGLKSEVEDLRAWGGVRASVDALLCDQGEI